MIDLESSQCLLVERGATQCTLVEENVCIVQHHGVCVNQQCISAVV